MALAALVAGCGPGEAERDLAAAKALKAEKTKQRDTQVEPAMASLAELLGRWNDAVDLGKSASRISLPPVVQNMQAIKRDVDAAQIPGCLSVARHVLSKHMGAGIDGFLAFMAQRSPELDFERSRFFILRWKEDLACLDAVTTSRRMAEITDGEKRVVLAALDRLAAQVEADKKR